MCKEKKKIQPKKIVYGIVNFGSIKLNKQTWYCRYCSKLKKRKKKKKDKVAQQNGTVDVQRKNIGCTVQKHCTRICAFIYKKKEYKFDDWKKKESTYWTNQKYSNFYTFT